MRTKPIMHKTSSALILILSILLLSCRGVPAFAQDKHFLWRVQSQSGSGFILGSVHVLKPTDYPLARIIENAFEHSGSLAVEINLNGIDPDAMKRLFKDAFYTGGDSIDKHLASGTLERVKKSAEEMGLNYEFLKKQKPWFLAISLPSIALLRAGYDPNYGIDMHFLKKAQGKKKIIEIESLNFQVRLLAELPPDQQELLLIYTLKELKGVAREADRLIEAWKAGNEKEVETISTQAFKGDPRLEPFTAKLLADRNKTMADIVEKNLNKEDGCLFIIGAAHLVGDKGVIRILRERGLKLDQL